MARYVWSDVLEQATLASGANRITNLAAQLEDTDVKTCIRLIVELEFLADQVNEVENTQLVDIGVGVASVEAFGIGVTALPAVDVVTQYPPMGWLYIARSYELQTLPTGGTPTAMYRHPATFKADIRTARKVDRGILYINYKSTPFGGTAIILDVIGRVRSLWMI